MSRTKKVSRPKLYVARVGGRVAGISHGYTEAQARKLFSVQRKIPMSCIEVTWTGSKKVSLAEFQAAMAEEVDFLADDGS